MKQESLTYVAAAFLLLLWAVLVFTGHENQGLIDEIKYMLMALGFVHGATNLQRVPAQKGGSAETSSNPPVKDAP